jgi:hypothetical protein
VPCGTFLLLGAASCEAFLGFLDIFAKKKGVWRMDPFIVMR